jgi:hypothetical protein
MASVSLDTWPQMRDTIPEKGSRMSHHPEHSTSMPPSGPSRVRWLALAACPVLAAVALALSAPSASALLYSGVSFGPDGTSGTAFDQPYAVGVDPSTGEVYVDDRGTQTVEKFNSHHEPEPFTGPLNPNIVAGRLTGVRSEHPAQIAVNSTSHDFYLTEPSTLVAYQSDGEPADFTAGPGAGTNELSGLGILCGVAVDGNGDIYVSNFYSGVEVYTPNGEPITSIPDPEYSCEIAVDSHGSVYVSSDLGLGVDKLVPSAFPVTPSTTYAPAVLVAPNGYLNGGLAVDPATNHLYVGAGGQVAEYDEGAGTLVGTFERMGQGAESIAATGEAGQEKVYVTSPGGERQVEILGPTVLVPAVSTELPSGVSETGMTLHGSVNPAGNEVTECYFEYGTEPGVYTNVVACEPSPGEEPGEIGKGTSPVPVSAKLSGLPPASARSFRLIATSLEGVGRGQGIAISSATLVSESASEVTEDSATLAAEIEPHGVSTEYYFEYGPCISPTTCSTSPYERSTPAGSLPDDLELHKVSDQVQNLSPGTTYHYRAVAANAFMSAPPPEHSFRTQTTAPFVLPDGRQWEMVSPPQKNGAQLAATGADQAAAAGAAVTYNANVPTESEPGGYASLVQVFSWRGVDGWSSRDLGIPHIVARGISAGTGVEWKLFSTDLSRGVVQPFGEFVACESEGGAAQPCLSEEASEQTAFLRTNFLGGNVDEPCVSACYRPLVTGKEGFADVTAPGAVFGGGANTSCGQPFCGPNFEGAASDLSHIVLRSGTVLTQGGGEGLYEWSAGEPAGEALQFIGAGSLGGNGSAGVRHAISEDGSRVVGGSGAELLLYENVGRPASPGGECTDAAEACTLELSRGLHEPVYQTASSDMSVVYFSAGEDLYAYDVEDQRRELVAEGFVGTVPGASEDGSWLYFVSRAVLENGGLPVPGAIQGDFNLYVLHGGVTRLVAVLSGQDASAWGGERGVVGKLLARVSPNGEWFAFMSERSLTGYDNTDAVSGALDEEVYLYDAATGGLVCTSCDPTGARPDGAELGRQEPLVLHNGGNALETGRWIAANLPEWDTETAPGEKTFYQPRYLSDSGRLFFDTADSLVPKDVNGTQDVYEYEPQGAGPRSAPCGPGAVSGAEVFEPARSVQVEGRTVEGGAGCVALISSGTSAQESAFMDASEEGSDVFFLTTSKLAPQDFDTSLDVYDAQECSAQEPCPAAPAQQPPECTSEASCRAAPSPQPSIFGLSGSATFSGAGNLTPAPPPPSKALTAAQLRAQQLAKALKACHKKHGRRARAVCERRARKRYGAASKARKSREHRSVK